VHAYIKVLWSHMKGIGFFQRRVHHDRLGFDLFVTDFERLSKTNDFGLFIDISRAFSLGDLMPVPA
jgi:hypothetical protein